jgi:mitogen-activated protein kinase organizer 1
VRHQHSETTINAVSFLFADPVTSVVPTQDESTYLVMTLDGHIRLMDAIAGKLLNDFSGHAHSSYRCRACFGHGEASVVAGDESGAIWAWDLLDVSHLTLHPYAHQRHLSERSPPDTGKTSPTKSSSEGTP